MLRRELRLRKAILTLMIAGLAASLAFAASSNALNADRRTSAEKIYADQLLSNTLSPGRRAGIERMIEAQRNSRGSTSFATKGTYDPPISEPDQPVPWPEGIQPIISGSWSSSQFVASNMWLGYLDGVRVMVEAGRGNQGDYDVGMVVLSWHDQRGNPTGSRWFTAAGRHGALTLKVALGQLLKMTSRDGTPFTLDLSSLVLRQ